MGVGFGEFDAFGFGGFHTMFSIVFFIITVGFIVILVSFVKNIMIWNKNNHSPQLTVSATIVSKRMNISRHRHANAGDITGAHGYYTTLTTYYYITFEFDSGDRMEFPVKSSEYGTLAEGDRGNLCFQGTRYLSFERDR